MTRNTKQNEKPAHQSRRPAYVAWRVEERGGIKYWSRLGAAWRHQKGEGLTLFLDLVPIDGSPIVLRAPSENSKASDEASPETTAEAGA